MARSAALTLTAFDILLCLAMAACGASMTNLRMMQSLMVAPSSADAQKSNGQVQFTATGTFSMAPTTVMSPPVLWSVGNPSFMAATPTPMSNVAPSAVSATGPSIDSNGLAQCNGFNGAVTIEATAPSNPNITISQMSQMTQNITGMATLICP
jgi:hypothetical protein